MGVSSLVLKTLGMGVSVLMLNGLTWPRAAQTIPRSNVRPMHREAAQSMEIITGWELCILVFSEAATGDITDAIPTVYPLLAFMFLYPMKFFSRAAI